jgi:acyl carrier protein
MEIKEFIADFADQFDETDAREFKAESEFRDFEEWSSLTGLAVLNMIGKKYGVKVTPAELKLTNTIEGLYNLVISKK